MLSTKVFYNLLVALLAQSSLALPVAEADFQQLVIKVDLDQETISQTHNIQDRSHLSFLDQYFGPILDNVGAVQISAVNGQPKKHPETPITDPVSSLLIRDNYNYPDKDDLRDLNGSAVLYRGGEFGGVDTFAHLPYAECFNPDSFEKEAYDIAIVGAPFDSGVSFRPGARFGPHGIRAGSRRLASAYSVYDGADPYGSWAKLVDCGSIPATPLDNRIALDQLYRGTRAVGRHATTAKNKYSVPKVFTLGGDHTITLPAIRAAYDNWNSTIAVIHFDSHLDTWNPYYFGGNITEYQSVNHGTYLHWAHEKGLLTPDSNMHVAIRGPYPGPDDVKHDIECGFDRILARDIDTLGGEIDHETGKVRLATDVIIEKIKQRVGDNYVYITVDVDSMDPSVAPASGTVEPGGWTSRELLTVLDGLKGLKVVGGDVVEVAPAYDTAAEITAIAAAQVADSIITLMMFDSEQTDEK